VTVDYVDVGALTLHTLAMMIVLGYYGILGRVILPALRRTLAGPELGASLAAVERRAFLLVGLAVVIFTATGSYLLVVDDGYAGLGNFFASTWTTLMLVKHGLVILMVGLGIGIHRLVGGVADAPSEVARETALGLLGLAAESMTVMGAIVVLLTTIAQLS
jgi:uncharacterized membrane protein